MNGKELIQAFTQGTCSKAERKTFISRPQRPNKLAVPGQQSQICHYLLTEFSHPLWFMDVMTAGGKEQGHLQPRALMFLTTLQLRCMLYHLSHAWEHG